MSSLPGRYVYETPWPAYALAWAVRADPRYRFAIGSFCESVEKNAVQVVELNPDTQRFEKIAEIEQPLPQTKIMWKPTDTNISATEHGGGLLAMSAAELEFHSLEEGKLKLVNKVTLQRKDGVKPPLTSFDWCHHDETKLGTASIDTTCSIYNLERMKVESQLIAHDTAVFDFAFGWGTIFATVGADGSLRTFDQRNLSQSVIFYESNPAAPLFRVAWNKLDRNYVAVVTETAGITILDMRRPSVALTDSAPVGANANCIAWAPQSRNHLIYGADDGRALIWDITQAPDTMLSYETNTEVYQVQWPETVPDHVALGTPNHVEVLRT